MDRFGGPKESKIEWKPRSRNVQNEKSENVDFCYPSHQKSMVLGPNGSRDEAQMGFKTDFYTA